MTSGIFRLSAKDLFLTYPQCNARPPDVYAFLRTVLKDIAFAAICCEEHESGDPHLHAIVHLTKRCNLHRADCLDIPNGQGGVFHGNYQAVRDKRACLNYVEKDGHVEFFDTTMAACRAYFGATDVSGGAGGRLGLAYNRMLSGEHVSQLLDDDQLCGTVVMYQDRLLKAVSATRLFDSLKKTEIFLEACAVSGGMPALRIANWLNENLLQERQFAQKQLYIHGPTMHGKTTLVNQLDRCLRIYYMPHVEYYDLYDDSLYDLIVVDEFKAQKTIQFMNAFLDGSVVNLNQKFRGVVKRKNLPVLVLSNWELKGCYTKCDDTKLETLDRRFTTVALETPFKLTIKTKDA